MPSSWAPGVLGEPWRAWAAGDVMPLCASHPRSEAGCRYHRAARSWAQLPPCWAMLTQTSHPQLGLVFPCLGTQGRGPDCASLGPDLCCGGFLWAREGIQAMEWSQQAVFLGRTALTSCLRLRERTQCPDPEPMGQATQNHLQGGDTALSPRVSTLLCLAPSLALCVGLPSAIP